MLRSSPAVGFLGWPSARASYAGFLRKNLLGTCQALALATNSKLARRPASGLRGLARGHPGNMLLFHHVARATLHSKATRRAGLNFPMWGFGYHLVSPRYYLSR